MYIVGRKKSTAVRSLSRANTKGDAPDWKAREERT
jgi:hypothetical protein